MTPDIKKILDEIDGLREKWEKLIEEGKSEPEWKQKVTINFTDRFNKKELCGLDLKVAMFLGDVMVSMPNLFDSLPALRDYITRLERESEAGKNTREEIKKRVSKMDSNKDVLPPEFFDGYRQAYAEMDRTADDIYRSACEGEK
jgi:hypothetical protein